MSGTPALYSPNAMRAEKRAVAGNSVIAALLITTGKIVVGITTGSLGILSEAAHSALDLIAALLTYLSVGVSDKPADADHQYCCSLARGSFTKRSCACSISTSKSSLPSGPSP
jgi:Co/Zn/Cd efflux system component